VPGRVYSLIDTSDERSNVVGNPNARFAHYLDLSGIRCLTVSCHESGFCNIAINGDLMRRLGGLCPRALPLTFYFANREVIESIHTLTELHLRPYLLVSALTMSNRRLTWLTGAEHVDNHSEGTQSILWTTTASLVCRRRGQDLEFPGLHQISTCWLIHRSVHPVEQASLNRSLISSTKRIAAFSHDSYLPALDGCKPNYIPKEDFFSSKARLSNIKMLKTQIRSRPLVGMYIGHHDGVTETLGQWDPQSVATMVTVFDYEATPKDIDSVTFLLLHRAKFKGYCFGILLGPIT
jgi:hypothetical protein